MPAVYKIAISRKTKFFGSFYLFFLDSMDLWHYPSNYSVRFFDKQSLQILICSLLQAKHLVITQEKDDGIKMVLFYCLQQNVCSQATYDLNVAIIIIAIRQGCRRSQLI